MSDENPISRSVDLVDEEMLHERIAKLEAERDEYKRRLIADLRDSAKLLYDLNDHDNAGRNEDEADALEEGGE